MKQLVTLLCMYSLLLAACEKLPFPKDNTAKEEIDNVKLYDPNGKEITDFYAGLKIRISSEQLKDIAIPADLLKEGMVIFDKTATPIIGAGPGYIETVVPVLNYITSLKANIFLRYRYQQYIICSRCNFFYRPTVRGQILTGYSSGKPDGTFNMPAEMTLDAGGNIYVIDQRTTHDVVLKVTPAGVTTTFAGAAGEFGRLVGIGIDQATSTLYLADATAQRIWKAAMASPTTVTILAGSGTAGNTDGVGTAASFRFGPQQVSDFATSERGQGLALDNAGNVYVGESSNVASLASQLRKITPAGLVTTLPGSLVIPMGEADVAIPTGVYVHNTGDVYYTSGTSGFFQGITRITGAGISSRFAGKTSFEGLNDGTGAIAQLSYPKAITGYGSYLYVADGTNGALRRISSSGEVITLAGVGHFHTNRFCGCGALPPLEGSYLQQSLIEIPLPDFYETAAQAIRMDQVGGVAVRTSGLIYVSDHGYRCIWKITIH